MKTAANKNVAADAEQEVNVECTETMPTEPKAAVETVEKVENAENNENIKPTETADADAHAASDATKTADAAEADAADAPSPKRARLDEVVPATSQAADADGKVPCTQDNADASPPSKPEELVNFLRAINMTPEELAEQLSGVESLGSFAAGLSSSQAPAFDESSCSLVDLLKRAREASSDTVFDDSDLARMRHIAHFIQRSLASPPDSADEQATTLWTTRLKARGVDVSRLAAVNA